MAFLLEEIAIEVSVIVATLVAAACLVGVLAGFAREHLALRTAAQPSDAGRLESDARLAERTARVSTFTPSHN